MLTVTETVQRNLTPAEKIALDDLDVFQQYLDAMNNKDRTMATAYAKIFMLKAMCMKP